MRFNNFTFIREDANAKGNYYVSIIADFKKILSHFHALWRGVFPSVVCRRVRIEVELR